MKKETTPGKPGSPFAKAVKANGFLFVSGNVAIDPETGSLVEGGIQEQTHQTLKNLKAIVEGEGSSFDDVVKVNVYLVDVQDFSAMNEVYKQYFPVELPTRTTVGINELARPEFLIEIDLIAAL